MLVLETKKKPPKSRGGKVLQHKKGRERHTVYSTVWKVEKAGKESAKR